MKYNAEHEDWKMDAPYLATLPKVNPFVVPEGYFQETQLHVSRMVWIHGLQSGHNYDGFFIPADYFSNLPAQLTLRIHDVVPDSGFDAEVALQPGSVLSNPVRAAGLPAKTNEQEFKLPAGYFEQLSSRIQQRIEKEKAQERVIKPVVLKPVEPEVKVRRLWHSDWMKYATAACVILVAALGLFLNQQQQLSASATNELANEQLLFDIPEEDIINHVLNENPDQHFLNAAHTDLESYLINNYSQDDLTIDL